MLSEFEFFLIKEILNKIIKELITSTPINKGAKSAPYNCHEIILIIAAEDKSMTAQKRNEVFLILL